MINTKAFFRATIAWKKAFVILLLLFSTSQVFSAKRKSINKATQAKLLLSIHVSRALSFFYSEADHSRAEKLFQDYLVELSRVPVKLALLTAEQQTDLLSPLESVIAEAVKTKKRTLLLDSFKAYVTALGCLGNQGIGGQNGLCARLERDWRDHLSSLMFFESTAARMAEADLLVQNKECQKASDLLRDVQIAEGAFKALKDLKMKLIGCPGLDEQKLSKEIAVMSDSLEFFDGN